MISPTAVSPALCEPLHLVVDVVQSALGGPQTVSADVIGDVIRGPLQLGEASLHVLDTALQHVGFLQAGTG